MSVNRFVLTGAITFLQSQTQKAPLLSIVSAACILVILTQPAMAGTPPPVDIAGVKLGMTRDQAVAALKQTDPSGSVQAPLTTDRPQQIERIWDHAPDLVFISADIKDMGSLPWDQVALLKECSSPGFCSKEDHERYLGNLRSKLTSPKVVAVWFSPVKSDDTVIAVTSDTVFMKNVPTVDAVHASLNQKYNLPPTIVANQADDSDVVTWRFDARGRPIPPSAKFARESQISTSVVNSDVGAYDCVYSDALRSRELNVPQCPNVYLPSFVREGDGVALVATIVKGATLCGGIRADLQQDFCPRPIRITFLRGMFR